VADERLLDERAEQAGEALLAIATAVRRYKSESGLSLGSELERLQLATADRALAVWLEQAEADLTSVTRAKRLTVGSEGEPGLAEIGGDERLRIFVARGEEGEEG
jgi:valyl-tRNA synthetase